MQYLDSTCWQVIQRAADGAQSERSEFAERYARPIRAYLQSRWQGTTYLEGVDDAVQEVFCECFREGGVLQTAAARARAGFRAFLFGVVRNVALRVEASKARSKEQQAPSAVLRQAPVPDDQSLSRVFDRAWAAGLVREAKRLLESRAATLGKREQDWVALLRIRFEEDLPIRDIAKRWEVDPAWLHHEYAQARQAFRETLMAVVGHHNPGRPHEVEAECREISAMLG